MGGEVLDGAKPAKDQDSDDKRKVLLARILEIDFQSGIDVCEDKSVVKPPHWKLGKNEKIKPACYTRQSDGGKKDLEIKIEILCLRNISGNATISGKFGDDLEIKSNDPFALQQGALPPIKCTFKKLPDSLYYFDQSVIEWEIELGGEKFILINTTPVILFIIFNKPALPWQSSGEKCIWAEALKFVFTKAGVNYYQLKEYAMKAITRYLHTGHPLEYDTEFGMSSYGVRGRMGGTFELRDYLAPKHKKVNCYDQAAGVMVLCAQLGINAKYVYLKPFGYINVVNLVGVGPCNNPFFNLCKIPPTHPHYDPWFRTFSNEKIWTSSQLPKKQTSFDNHAFVKYSGKIYDACAGPDVGTRTPSEYLEHAIDFVTSRNNGFYTPSLSTVDQIKAWLVPLIKSGISISVKKCN